MKNGKRRITRSIVSVLLTLVVIATGFPPAAAFAADEQTPKDIVDGMTTEEKVAQCLMMDFRMWKSSDGEIRDMTCLEPEVAEAIADYRFGSMILFANNIKTTEDTLQLVKDMQAAAISKGGLPLLVATDQEGGIVYRLGSGTALPGNMAVAATGDTADARKCGEIIGRELSSLGINTTLAPVIDVNNNANNPVIGTRSFGDDAETVGAFGAEYIAGLDEYNTIGCAKHFPGHGDTDTDSHTGLPLVDKSKEELMANELVPFKVAIDDGVDMIMTAHILYPQVEKSNKPATMSKVILTDILRNELGFNGVVVTDAMNMRGVSDYYTREEAALEALKAGADMICMPVAKVESGSSDADKYITTKEELTTKLDSLIGCIADAANNDPEVMARLDEAAGRIVKLKMEKGILDYSADDYSAEKALEAVGSSENRGLEREIAANAVTVIRNDKKLLPYRPAANTKVLMLCPNANQIAQMIMGLNRAKAAGLMPQSVKVDVFAFTKDNHELNGALKEKIDWADFVIVNSKVYDSDDMSFGWYTSVAAKSITEYCKAAGKKSVVMSVDKPYDVQLYPDADAVIVVYGNKGSTIEAPENWADFKATEDKNACGPNIVAGVEVIFGVFGAQGALPVNVPVFDQETKSFTENIAYERGYGLKYKALKPLPKPGKAAIKSLKRGKRQIKVTMTCKPSKKGAQRYQVAYHRKGKTKWCYKTTSNSYIYLKKLRKGANYVIKVRAYSTVDGVRYYGKWSKLWTSRKVL